MSQPLVSVVIPFYSGLEWLKEALASVQEQTYKNIEVLVINDGSKDNIDEITTLYDLSILIFSKENGGPASARNLGIEKASGKYIAFLDSDDIWLPDKLSKQISYMESEGYVWSQHSYEMFWDGNNRTKIIDTSIYSGNVFRDCFISFRVQTSCVVVLRQLLSENNIRFPLEKRYGQDMAFFKHIARKYPLGYVDGNFTRFRIRGSNAGFRAKVQINDKASTWEEIKYENEILGILPRPVVFAYKLSGLLSSLINTVNKNLIKNDHFVELLSKLTYIFPYSIFRAYSRR